MDFTDDEKTENYCRMTSVINDLRNNVRITEDWMYDQMKFIKTCREFFPDMSKLNTEVVDPRWRAMAENCELVLSQLVFEIRETRSFSLPLYRSFCENIKKMFEMVMTDDELAQMMSSMGI
jgi:hypothetical protein